LENYKWSSYSDFKEIARLENKILNIEMFPDYFQNIKGFDTEIVEWLSMKFAEVGLPQTFTDKPIREIQLFPLIKLKKK
jgi:hypothetical protein